MDKHVGDGWPINRELYIYIDGLVFGHSCRLQLQLITLSAVSRSDDCTNGQEY